MRFESCKNFNTQNWKPCTLDLSPCGKRNAVKSRLGHLWIVFYKWYPPLFALSHPFKPLVDYRLLCSQYNTGRTSYSGTSLPKRPAFSPQNSLFPISKIHNIVIIAYTDYNPIYDGDWSAFAVHCNVCHGKWKRMDGSQKTTICRICEQPEHSVQVFMKQWLCIKGDLWFQTKVEEDISNRFKMLDISNRFKIWDFKYILNVDLWLHSCTASNPPSLLWELQRYRTLCASVHEAMPLYQRWSLVSDRSGGR